MVKIEDVTVENLHSKLKTKKVGKLIKEVFGEDINISEGGYSLFIRVKPKDSPVRIIPNSFLKVDLSRDYFILTDKKYFDKTKELADKYETNFGGEVIIKTNYSK